MPDIEERVSTLEGALMRLAYMQVNTQINLNDLSNLVKHTQTALEESDRKTRAAMDEEWKKTQANLEEYRKENQIIIKEMKDDAAQIRKEMKDDAAQIRKETNYKWGKLAEKLGTLVEDMVAPNIKSIAKKYFNLTECEDFITNRVKRHPVDKGREKEFDVIAVYGDTVILNETKVTPRMKYVEEFIEFVKKGTFYEFFPEYNGKILIPIFASMNIPDNVITHLSRNNILAMAMGEENMDIVNPEIIQYIKVRFH
jgi:hypothetical protein